MLDLIRSNSQSFGVKLAFGIIILVFVFWGIGSITDTGSVNVVAMVNGHPITFQTFEMAYRRAEEQANQSNPGRRWTDQDKSQLGHQVFQSLLSEELLVQEAGKNGFSVSPLELRKYVENIPAFRNDKGQFDPALYTSVLRQQRQSPAEFEAGLTRQLLQEKMAAFVAGGVWLDPSEPRSRYNFLKQQRVAEYIYLPASAAGDVPAPSEEESRKYYEAHKQLFAVPQKVSVEYVAVDPAHLVDPKSISADEARKWYDAHQSDFSEPDRVLVSHILVPLARDASAEDVKKAEAQVAAIQKELASGKSFAEVADAHNAPQAAGKGGSVGWVEPGMTVPEFEKAAFAAEKGRVVGPVRTQFGLHLIFVEDKKAARVKPFDEVKDQIAADIAKTNGKSRVNDVLDSLIEENILGKPLADAAQKYGLKAEKTDLLAKADLQQKLSVTPEGADTIFRTGNGHSVDVPLEAGDSYVIVRVDKSVPATFKDFADVKADVEGMIRAEAGREAGKKTLEAALKDLQKGTVPDSLKGRVKTSEPVDRGGAMAPFNAQQALDEALFSAPLGQWIPTVFAVSTQNESGVLVCRTAKIIDPSDKDWSQFGGFMSNLTQRERVESIYEAFLQEIADKSKINIMNQDAIDRKNM